MTLLSDFRYDKFVASTGALIAEYAAEEDPKPASSYARVQQALYHFWSPQLSVQNQWTQLWKKELEAEKFVTSVLSTKRIYISVWWGKAFINAIHFLLVEMAKAPLEKEFLDELVLALQKVDKKVVIGMDANESCCRESSGVKTIDVNVLLTQTVTSLFRTAQGKLCISTLCTRTILAHELLHAHQEASGMFAGRTVQTSYRWTNEREKAAIQGDETISSFSEKFNENAFAYARGEPERLSHRYFLPDPRTLPKSEQFYHAVRHGVDLCNELSAEEHEALDEKAVAKALATVKSDVFRYSEDRQAYGIVMGGKAAVSMRLDQFWSPEKIKKLDAASVEEDDSPS